MTEHDYDVVVVGSGAGGGTVAAALAPLAREGARIAVLEWGARLREEEFTGRELEMAERLYVDGGGLLNRDRTMTIALGRAYGGSTVVFTGTSLPVARATLESWGVPALTHEDVAARIDRYATAANAHLMPPELINDNNRLFREGCERLGWHVAQFPVNVKGCRGSGLCNLGCPNAAKQGTHRVQLPEAEAAGVEVVTRCRVARIAPRSLDVVVAPAGDHGLPSPWAPGAHRVRARIIVLAAGAVHTPALMLASGLGAELPALGRYFTCHPALILVAQHDASISNYHGHPKSYYSEEFAESGRFLLETCMYFPFVTAKSLAGFGPDHSLVMSRMDRLQMILALGLDEADPDNRIRVGPDGGAVVDYRLSERTLDALHGSMRAAARIFFAAGARRVHAQAASPPLLDASEQGRLEERIPRAGMLPGKVSISSAHPMGGCRMGRTPADSVTDAWGQVHGHPWLFVADASLFPSSAHVNPYLTIMALADRVAERVRARASEAPNEIQQRRPESKT